MEVDRAKTQQFCETSSKMKVDTSKIKKFGQISSIFEVGTIENEAIQRDKRPAPAIVFASATAPSRFAHFWQGANPLRL